MDLQVLEASERGVSWNTLLRAELVHLYEDIHQHICEAHVSALVVTKHSIQRPRVVVFVLLVYHSLDLPKEC